MYCNMKHDITPMNRIIIADIKSPCLNGRSTGHYFTVAQNYYELFCSHVKTHVAGGPIYDTRFTAGQMLRLPYNCLLMCEPSWKSKLKYLMNARALFCQAKGDTIVVQQGGVLSSFIAIALFYHRKSRLFLIQYSREGVDNCGKRWLYRLVKHKIDGVVCPNEMVGEAYGRPFCVVPDYIYLDGNDIPDVSYKDKKYDVCFVGRIEEEKGVLDVAHKLAGTSRSMIIAGKVRDEDLAAKLEQIASSCKNIELHIGYVSDENYYGYIRNSRFCILNYQGEYSRRSSGVVLDTIFNNVPVIGKRCKALDFIHDFGCGYIYDDLDSLDLDTIMTEQNYDIYLHNIALYKQKHVEYAEKLMKFLGL